MITSSSLLFSLLLLLLLLLLNVEVAVDAYLLKNGLSTLKSKLEGNVLGLFPEDLTRCNSKLKIVMESLQRS